MSPVPAARCGAGLRGEAGVAFCQGTVPTCGSVYMAIDPQAPLGPERAQRRGHVRPPWKMAKEPKVSQLLSRPRALLSAQAWGKAHTLRRRFNRAPTWASGPPPSSQAGEPCGPLGSQ